MSACLWGGTRVVAHADSESDCESRIEKLRQAVKQTGTFSYVRDCETSLDHLRETLKNAESCSPPEDLIEAHCRIVELHRSLANWEQAKYHLAQAKALVEKVNTPHHHVMVINCEGAYLAGRGQWAAAALRFEEALEWLSTEPTMRTMRCLVSVNTVRCALYLQDADKCAPLFEQAFQEIDALEASLAKGQLLIQLGQLAVRSLEMNLQIKGVSALTAYTWLDNAFQISVSLQDSRLRSYALGYLGMLYRVQQRHDDGLQLLVEAVRLAEESGMIEIVYLWEWEAARCLKDSGSQGVGAQYLRAIDKLESVRHEISMVQQANGKSFRESTANLYFELCDWWLKQAQTQNESQSKATLLQVIQLLDRMRTNELENYFHDSCVHALRKSAAAIESVSSESAVVHYIPFDDRLEILLQIDDRIVQVQTPVGKSTLMREVGLFRTRLENQTTNEYLEQAQRLHAWMIAPLENLINTTHIETLALVPDSLLLTIPFAALHDGKAFLFERYSLAISPGLTLMDPTPLPRRKVTALLAGLSESKHDLPPLHFVEQELNQINEHIQGKVLLNEAFNRNAFFNSFANTQFSLLHIAAHGDFRPDSREAFILMHDEKLSIQELTALIEPGHYRGKPLELLVLSACQTAAGNERVALGLAGVAFRSGARSTLGTLWSVNDESSARLMKEFYRNLIHKNQSKAAALRSAQLRISGDLRYQHPYFWSPFVLIGNWL